MDLQNFLEARLARLLKFPEAVKDRMSQVKVQELKTKVEVALKQPVTVSTSKAEAEELIRVNIRKRKAELDAKNGRKRPRVDAGPDHVLQPQPRLSSASRLQSILAPQQVIRTRETESHSQESVSGLPPQQRSTQMYVSGTHGKVQRQGAGSHAQSSVGALQAQWRSTQRSVSDTYRTQIGMVEETGIHVPGSVSALEQTNRHIHRKEDFQATDRGFSVALWDPETRQWEVERTLGLSAVAEALLARLLKQISGTHGRVNTWETMKSSNQACILVKVIRKVNTGSFRNANTAGEACSNCLGRTSGSGRHANPRPCAALLQLNNAVTIGFLPLPAKLREGLDSSDMKFWVVDG